MEPESERDVLAAEEDEEKVDEELWVVPEPPLLLVLLLLDGELPELEDGVAGRSPRSEAYCSIRARCLGVSALGIEINTNTGTIDSEVSENNTQPGKATACTQRQTAALTPKRSPSARPWSKRTYFGIWTW